MKTDAPKRLGRPKRGSVYQRKGSRNYWISWWGVNGKRHSKNTYSTTKQDALDELDRKRDDSKKGISPDTDRIYLADLERLVVAALQGDGKVSVDRAKRAFWHLKEQLAAVPVLQIPPLVDEYGAERRRSEKANDGTITKHGAAAATIRQELRWLGRGYRLAAIKGLIPYAPALPSVQVNNARQGFITAKQLEKLVSALPEHMKAPTRWAFGTGWRKGEVLGLTWSRVDLESGYARLRGADTKNRTAREFPFHCDPALVALIAERRAATTAWEREHGGICSWVFHRDGKRIRDFYTAWRNATKAAGLDGAIFHDLRRSFIKQAEDAGVPRSTGTRLSGHKTEDTYVRYAIRARSDLEDGVDKIVALRTRQAAKTG